MTALEELYLNGWNSNVSKSNESTDFCLPSLHNLQSLKILERGNYQIKNLDTFRQCLSLTELDCSKCGISDVEALANLENLERLNISDNEISDLNPLKKLTNLIALNADKNNISDITALSGLGSLKELRLDSNLISDITALSGLVSLESLHLSSNNISDVRALGNLLKLESLTTEDNPIQDYSPIYNLPGYKEKNYWQIHNRNESIKEDAKPEVKYGRKDGFRYSISDGEATILGYGWQDDKLIIPKIVEDCPVTKIADRAFEGTDFLKRVNLPDSLIEIICGAFMDCQSLTDVYFLCHNVDIGISAFDGCGKFTIHCHEGSSAHDFAVETERPFKIISNNHYTN